MNDKLHPGVYGLIDDSVRPELGVVEKARAALGGGVRTLQLRLKRTPDRQALAMIRETLEVARDFDAQVLVNDRVDLALAAGAHGVHLGDDDLPVSVARALLGPQALIGATVRDLQSLLRARDQGASYVGLGPIFATRTKSVSQPPLGLDGLKAVVEKSPLPVVAIAGIDLSNIARVAATGAHGAALASGLLEADDIAERARGLVAQFRSSRSLLG